MAGRTVPRPLGYFAHVVPGIEEIAREELRERIPDARMAAVIRRFDERTSVLLFEMSGPSASLCDLRTVEDLFITIVDRTGISVGWDGLPAITSIVSTARAERAAAETLRMRPRKGRTVTFRVIARESGRHAFRRVDMQKAVAAGLRRAFPQWKEVEDDAVIEAWAQLVGNRLLVGFRLSTGELRQRAWRSASIPAALKPTVAAAMVRLSRPRNEDVFLDPMCGSGTIPIERALAGRYKLILCGDAAAAAVAATRANVGRKYRPIEIHQWDATSVPLGDRSVDTIVCNLPFGKQILTQTEVRSLYPRLITEWTRVLRAPGQMVLLTSEVAALRSALRGHLGLRVHRETRVLVRGQSATIFTIEAGNP